MDLDEIWRFDLVRGFTRDPSHGACLLTAVSWLVDGKLTDRPRCACPLLAQLVAMRTIFCTRRTGSGSKPSFTG